MVSVVISVYNGERYITEQLESIKNQSVKPDEVIIQDDCSTDSTVEVISNFIHTYGLNNWKLYQNTQNVGWQKNFMQALKKAEGDLIFLADQDDIWKNNKLEKMLLRMEGNESISVLASNLEPYYMDEAVDKSKNDEKMKNDGTVKKYEFTHKFLYVKRPGCVYCVRKEFVNKVSSFWFKDCPHDALLWCSANVLGELYIYQEPLILFRRHANNASSMEMTGLAKKRKDAEYYKTLWKALIMIKKQEIDKENNNKNKIIEKVGRYCEYRRRFLNDRKLKYGIMLLGYLDCYYALKTYLADWAVVLFKNIKLKR